MKTRKHSATLLGALTVAALLSAGTAAAAQDRNASRPQSSATASPSRMLGILRHGDWECALPGDAGGAAFVVVADEGFRIGTASSYISPQGSGIYLMRGTEVVFTRGPKKDERFRATGENTLQKLAPDGTLSKLICTRIGGGT